MELNPSTFDSILQEFLTEWPQHRLQSMNITEYANLKDRKSFCYWLEYGSADLGAIGDNSLAKFELWRPKVKKNFAWFSTDGEYAWNPQKGSSAFEAFNSIRSDIIRIAEAASRGDLDAVNDIDFHSIAKWKIAFIYSNKTFLPIYSRRALGAIGAGLGISFTDKTPLSTLQRQILARKSREESIDNFAWSLYGKFAQKHESKTNFYIIGSKYGDNEGNDVIPMIDEFLKYDCVAIGFMNNVNFTQYMGGKDSVIEQVVDRNYKEKKPAPSKIKRYFKLLAQIKEGDIIAIKSHGGHNSLTIIAYAEVKSVNGSVYEYGPNLLGHQIHVAFLDAKFYKALELTYAETIHQLSPEKDSDKFFKVFGWYTMAPSNATDSSTEEDDELDLPDSGYNDKTEESFDRTPIASVKVNRLHNKIQNSFIRFLKEQYIGESISGERRRIDAKRENKIELVIYEIKPHESAFSCIREGIGQLLDYHSKTKTLKTKKIVIVGPNRPNAGELDFINTIKAYLNIPFAYMSFNAKTWESSEY